MVVTHPAIPPITPTTATSASTTLTNSLGETASYTYNATGQITAYTDFMGSTTLSHLRRNGTAPHLHHRPQRQYHRIHLQFQRRFSWRPISPTAAPSTATYDPEGSATSFLDAGGQYDRDVTYNSSGQITCRKPSDPTQYTYTYNAHGDLLTATDSTGTTSFTYDPNTDMLTGVAYPNGTYLAFS